MSNLATKDAGASVTSSTCTDERHPAATVIDGDAKTFWYTTGLFPQEVVIAFNKEVIPANVHIVSRHVRRFTVFKCDKSEPKSWDEVWNSGEVDRNLDALQHTQKQLSIKSPVRFLKLRLDAGWEEFVAVYEVQVEGKVIGGGGGGSSAGSD